MATKKILGAAIGNCVHVAGLHHFLKLAEAEGYITESLGPAVPVERIIKAIGSENPEIVAISYRLTPEVAAALFNELKKSIEMAGLSNLKMIFGGTPPVAEIARQSGIFSMTFDGSESIDLIRQFLKGSGTRPGSLTFEDSLIGRIRQKYPYPILRHHFGRPTLEETLEGVKLIAESGVLEVISLGPDQNAQEHFFHQEMMDEKLNGAGGVPVRDPKDLQAIYQASRTGNYPLLRCYAGTRDLIKWAEMSVQAINNAWGAIPLCWYSVIDGRSKRLIEEAVRENQSVMRWYAQRGIPVEVNESHQWSLRDAHDSLAVAMSFLAAYNAKKAGVRHYVSQFMFNTPPGTSAAMDIAKMLAKKELIEELEDEDFEMIREVRAGISHFSPVPEVAKGQLAASAVISLALKPHIMHVVGYSEGDHATLPGELIESCNIVHGVLRNSLYGFPDLTLDSIVKRRTEELKKEAYDLLFALRSPKLGVSDDPWSDPLIIANAIRSGLLDAPHFRGNPHLCGNILTRLINGAWMAVDPSTGEPVTEKNRTLEILLKYNVNNTNN